MEAYPYPPIARAALGRAGVVYRPCPQENRLIGGPFPVQFRKAQAFRNFFHSYHGSVIQNHIFSGGVALA